MYLSNVAGLTASSTSYDGAKANAKSAAATVARNVQTNRRLFRSPKTRTALASKLLAITFPKKSGDVSKSVNGLFTASIAKLA